MGKSKKPYKFWEQKEHKGKKSESSERREKRSKAKFDPKKSSKPAKVVSQKPETNNKKPATSSIRLNRYIAQSGVCSRREADELIKQGKIKINGKVVTELGKQVIQGKDKVEYAGKLIRPQKFVYILLNKPKNTITTMDDPQGRRTIMDLVKGATDERIFPVGRLDRNTTGLILLTNDGALAEKLTHPSNQVRKLYHVRLDKVVPEDDLGTLLNGIELEDGVAKADKIDYVSGKMPNEVGIQIHSGKNRIVRRMFEALDYNVLSLDRVMIAHLNKKHLPRGKWRQLSEKEVKFLNML